MRKNKMKNDLAEEIQLRLRAPAVALDRIAKGKHLPKIFAEAALEELVKIQKLAEELKGKSKE